MDLGHGENSCANFMFGLFILFYFSFIHDILYGCAVIFCFELWSCNCSWWPFLF